MADKVSLKPKEKFSFESTLAFIIWKADFCEGMEHNRCYSAHYENISKKEFLSLWEARQIQG